MTKKEELLLELMMNGKESLEGTKDSHQDMIDDYRKNGFGDTHPSNIEGIKTGLHYTHGYTIGHLELLKHFTSLIGKSEEELIDIISENEKISAENEKYMNDLLKNIKNG